jgi:Lon protease-like protein
MNELDTRSANDLVKTLPAFDVNLAVLPQELVPLHIFEERYKSLVSFCRGETGLGIGSPFVIFSTSDTSGERLGCSVEVLDTLVSFDDGRSLILVVGDAPVRVLEHNEKGEFPLAKVEFLPNIVEVVESRDLGALSDIEERVLTRFHETLSLAGYSVEVPDVIEGSLAFQLGASMQLDFGERKELLSIESETERLIALESFLRFRNQLVCSGMADVAFPGLSGLERGPLH